MKDFRFIRILKAPTQQLLEILNNNIIGTPGLGMLYQHLGVLNKIYKIEDPYFVNLERNNEIVGTGCFCSRTTINSGVPIPTFYIRYFSFKEKYRRKKINRKEATGTSNLRNEIRLVLSGQGLDKQSDDKFFQYAYVDPRNIRSLLLCNEFGFQPVRQYATIIFNRIVPDARKANRVKEALPEEREVIKNFLLYFYKEYTMFSFENLLNGRKYYTIKDQNGKIVAGVQVNPDLWNVIELPGLIGKLILNSFTYLPFLNRLFNKKYRFITLDGIFFLKGYEKTLEELFEGLLSMYKVNSAITLVDPETLLYKELKSMKLGLVDKLNKEVRGNVICNFLNFDDKEKEVFKANPAYISGIDVT